MTPLESHSCASRSELSWISNSTPPPPGWRQHHTKTRTSGRSRPRSTCSNSTSSPATLSRRPDTGDGSATCTSCNSSNAKRGECQSDVPSAVKLNLYLLNGFTTSANASTQCAGTRQRDSKRSRAGNGTHELTNGTTTSPPWLSSSASADGSRHLPLVTRANGHSPDGCNINETLPARDASPESESRSSAI